MTDVELMLVRHVPFPERAIGYIVERRREEARLSVSNAKLRAENIALRNCLMSLRAQYNWDDESTRELLVMMTAPRYSIRQGDAVVSEAEVVASEDRDQHGRERYIVTFKLPDGMNVVDMRPTPEIQSGFKPGDKAYVTYRKKMLDGNGGKTPIGNEFIKARLKLASEK